MGDIAGLTPHNLSVQLNSCVVEFCRLAHVTNRSSIARAEYAQGFLGKISLCNYPLGMGQKGQCDIERAGLEVQ